jgi:hypothetical protein
MSDVCQKSIRGAITTAVLLMLLAATWSSPALAQNKKKKGEPAPAAPTAPVKKMDTSVYAWPPSPAIARLKYLDYFSAQKPDTTPEPPKAEKKKWMDRLAGVSQAEANKKAGKPTLFQLLTPYGMAVDSKGMLYIADTKVGAIFIVNPETGDTGFIKHGVDAKFGHIFGLAIDDSDRIFVSDGLYNHVLVFNAQHKLEGVFGEGVMNDAAGLAIDKENRFLYVANTGTDQILVYDADTFKLLRKIGTAGKDHTLTAPGEFSKPTNVAVDKDGNLFVTDTLNDRIEVFDADGVFIRAFGKNGDGIGQFARPKGIAVDSDGHIWVADAMLNRLQVFTKEGQVLLGFGGFGQYPGQFQGLTGLTIDSKNRLFTSEQYMGRVQMFRYVPEADARVEYERRKAEVAKGASTAPAGAAQPAPTVTPEAQKPAPPAAAAPQAPATAKPDSSTPK